MISVAKADKMKIRLKGIILRSKAEAEVLFELRSGP